MHQQMIEVLLGALHAGEDPAAQGRQMGLSLSEVANWSAGSSGASAIAALKALAHARSSLAVARAKVEAAQALLALAQDTESKETARKACVDLLRLEEPIAEVAAAESPLTEDETNAWLAALERLGAARESPAREQAA